MFLLQMFAFLCLLAADCCATEDEDMCVTAWFDDGDPSIGGGDSELLTELRRRHGARICPQPEDMEVQTVGGLQQVRDTLHTRSPSEGLLCVNSEQEDQQCDDYKVKFTCTGVFCSACRTRWFDLDNPTGNGDFEVLSELRRVFPGEICPQPLAIQAQSLSGDSASATSDTFLNYDATYGLACVNAAQSGRSCQDYRVRFSCPRHFCQASVECRTQWLNSDHPSEEGDVESIAALLKAFPAKLCREPTTIQVRTTGGIPAQLSGDTFLSWDVTFGFACINAQQSGKRCADYEVMLTCPPDFCQSCRTDWFDWDDPSERGDYEMLAQLRAVFPAGLCSQPLAVEAVTADGDVPATRTGDVFQVYDASRGFACVNEEQGGGRRCSDYKVRFTCPLEFCSQ